MRIVPGTEKQKVIVLLSMEFLKTEDTEVVNSLVRVWWKRNLRWLNELLIKKRGDV